MTFLSVISYSWNSISTSFSSHISIINLTWNIMYSAIQYHMPSLPIQKIHPHGDTALLTFNLQACLLQ